MVVCNSGKRARRRSLLVFAARLVYMFCAIAAFCVPCMCNSAGGVIPDLFVEAPRNGDAEGVFAIPEIAVIFLPPGIGHYGDYEVVRVERWEYMRRRLGYVVGYVQRNENNELQICACTKWTSILDSGLARELEIKRTEQEDELTNFEDLSLDDRVRDRCEYMNTWKGCVSIIAITPDLPVFCNAFAKESRIQVLPMEFRRQSYFTPGLRVITEDRGASKAQDLYLGASRKHVPTRSSKVKSIDCKGEISKAFGELSGCSFPAESPHSGEDVSSFGYLLSRNGEEICIERTSNSGKVVDCVPAPSLQRPSITAIPGDKVQIKFNPCKGANGQDTDYCDVTMGPGDRDSTIGFAVARPKFDIGRYDFALRYVCDEPGVELKDCKQPRQVYDEDPSGNVTCLMDLQFSPKKFYVKRDGRYYWIRELPKVLVGRSRDTKAKRNLLCADSASLDLATMRQEDIDRMRGRGRFFRMIPPEGSSSSGDVLCKDNMLYFYDNDRVFAHDTPAMCSSASRDGVIGGHCKTRYVSEDDHQPFFLQESEELSTSAVTPLNSHMQGLCVSNFPAYEYKYYSGNSPLAAGLSVEESNKHLLEISRNNTQCDFIKIEMWGGGESGSLRGGAKVGRPGEYVMGVLKVNPEERKYLITSIGHGGAASLDNKGASNTRNPGGNTVALLCDDVGGETCSLKLTASGGGQPSKGMSSSGGYEKLVHYRVAEGRTEIRNDEVFVPYQSIDFAEGRAGMDAVGCISNSPSDKQAAVKVLAPGKYMGAGGCARADIKAVQSGAHGMVKLTCEKWSGDPGKVKEWEGSFCNKEVLELLNLFKKHAAERKLDEKANNFFADVASMPFCRGVTGLPKLPQVLDALATVVKGNDVTKKNKKEAKTWINQTLAPLSAILDGDSRVINAYVKAQKALKRTSVGGKKEFANGFEELIKSKVSIIADSSEVLEMLKRLKDYAGGQSLKSNYILAALESKEFAEDVAKSPDFVEWLESTVKNIGSKQGLAFENEQEVDAWVGGMVASLKKALTDDVEVAKAYERVISKLGGSIDAKGHESIVDSFIEGFKELAVKATSTVLDRVLELLEQLKNHAEVHGVKSQGVFRRIAKSSFPRAISGHEEFIAGLEAVAAVISAEDKVFDNAKDIETWVESSIAPVVKALNKEGKIVEAYANVRYDETRSKRAYDEDAKSELITNFRDLVRSKAIDSSNYWIVEDGKRQKRWVMLETHVDPVNTGLSARRVLHALRTAAQEYGIRDAELIFDVFFRRAYIVLTVEANQHLFSLLEYVAYVSQSERAPDLRELRSFRSSWDQMLRRIPTSDLFPEEVARALSKEGRHAELARFLKDENYVNRYVRNKVFEALKGILDASFVKHSAKKTEGEYKMFANTLEAMLKRTKIWGRYKDLDATKRMASGTFAKNAAGKSRCLAWGLNNILLIMEGVTIARESIPDFDSSHAFTKQMLHTHTYRYLEKCLELHGENTPYDGDIRKVVEGAMSDLLGQGNYKNVTDQEFVKALNQLQALSTESGPCPETESQFASKGTCCGVRMISHPAFLKVANQEFRNVVKDLVTLLSSWDRVQAFDGLWSWYSGKAADVLNRAFDSSAEHKRVYKERAKAEAEDCDKYIYFEPLGLSLYDQVQNMLYKRSSALREEDKGADALQQEYDWMETYSAIDDIATRAGYPYGDGASLVFIAMRDVKFVNAAEGTLVLSFLLDHLLPILKGDVKTFATLAEADAWIEGIEAHMEKFAQDSRSLNLLMMYGDLYLGKLSLIENMMLPFHMRSQVYELLKGPRGSTISEFVKRQKKSIEELYLEAQLHPPEGGVSHPLLDELVIYDRSSLTRAMKLAGMGVPYIPMVNFYHTVRELLKNKVRVVS
ncbi:hypothetical protein FY192_02670 [Anaplasma marginale]|uniref:glycine-rich domain-containing protein n=1 Tax=Anaplasma marginale TaxID=770 RepID=UPI001248BD7F|nr:hypothetical protein [Anaplasma marginale]KAB0452392.1 hypothetical protein FY192_02670 [Anaplasma marginale]